MNGYELAEEIFHNIGLNENHEISNNDVVRVISFWGFNEDSSRSTRIGFVCYCAREKIRKAFEKGLVYRDFKLFDELMESINSYRVKQSESADDECKGCYYNDGEVHAECIICDKAESEVNNDD